MKKFILIPISCIALIFAIILLIFGTRATIKNEKIIYGDTVYLEWNKIADKYVKLGIIEKDDMFPYHFIDENLRDKIYLYDSFLPPYEFFSFYGNSDDFIVRSPNDSSLNILYVREGFNFPNLNNNQVESIWMSLASDDINNITERQLINTIISCIQKTDCYLSKDIVKYIKENSWNNCSIFLKYKGFSLVDEYQVIFKNNQYSLVRGELKSDFIK